MSQPSDRDAIRFAQFPNYHLSSPLLSLLISLHFYHTSLSPSRPRAGAKVTDSQVPPSKQPVACSLRFIKLRNQ